MITIGSKNTLARKIKENALYNDAYISARFLGIALNLAAYRPHYIRIYHPRCFSFQYQIKIQRHLICEPGSTPRLLETNSDDSSDSRADPAGHATWIQRGLRSDPRWEMFRVSISQNNTKYKSLTTSARGCPYSYKILQNKRK